LPKLCLKPTLCHSDVAHAAGEGSGRSLRPRATAVVGHSPPSAVPPAPTLAAPVARACQTSG
jgi:hypothetical protein